MSFSAPWLLALGLVVVAALAVATHLARRRRQAALTAAGISSAAGSRAGVVGVSLTLAGIAVLAFAAAGPAASVPVTRAAGTVILAVDVSNSMGADDVEPTRLDAAKKAAREFIDAQPDSVDIGVVAFQNGALTTDLPSSDHAAAASAVSRLKVSGGTSIASAILTSLTAITGKPVTVNKDGSVGDIGYWSSATIVLFSDGGDSGGGGDGGDSGGGGSSPLEVAAETAQAAGVKIETVGIGTTAGTTVNVDGYQMQTALDEDVLKAIADTTRGTYHPASDADQINNVAKTISTRLTTHHENMPLAGAFTMGAILLLAAGGTITVLRTGRVV